MKFSVLVSLALTASVALSAQSTPTAPTGAAAKPPATAPKSRPATTATKPAVVPPAGKSATTGATPAASPASDNKVVLTIGDQKITAKEFDLLIDALPEQYRTQARGPMKRQMAEQIARVKLLSNEARKRGLDKDELTQSRIRFQEDNLLAGAFYNDMVQKTNVGDAELQKYFDEHKNEFESVSARHILIKFKGSPVPTREGKPEMTEDEALAKANDLKKQLASGADFSELAKKESDDAGSGANGGELGTFSHGQMVPAFEEAAFKLPVGQVSDPIKTQFGYHIIKVDKHETKTLDQVKPELAGKLKPEAARKAVEDLSKTAGIKLDEAYFGPEQPAPGAGAPPAGAPPAGAPGAPPAKP